MLLILGDGRLAPDQRQGHQQHRQRQPDPGRELDRDARDRRRVRAPCMWLRESRRRASGLVAPPASVTAAQDRGRPRRPGSSLVLDLQHRPRDGWCRSKGVPWVVLIVLGVLAAWTLAARPDQVRPLRLRHRRQRRGGAPRRREPGRASGRSPSCSARSPPGSRGSSTPRGCGRCRRALDGGTLVLYAVAAAVIGGTSLFGGRGKAMHAVLGGLVIAAIDNGMGLQGYSAAAKYVVTRSCCSPRSRSTRCRRRGRIAR